MYGKGRADAFLRAKPAERPGATDEPVSFLAGNLAKDWFATASILAEQPHVEKALTA